MKVDPNSISVHQPTGAEEGGAGRGALPGGGAGVPHGDTIDVQVGGDSTGLNSHQVPSNTWKTQTGIVSGMQTGEVGGIFGPNGTSNHSLFTFYFKRKVPQSTTNYHFDNRGH